MVDINTIENNHVNLLNKLSIVGNMIDIVVSLSFDCRIVRNRIKYIRNIYDNMKNGYEIDVVDVLSNYYDKSDLLKHMSSTHDSYVIYVTCENYGGKLKQCFNFVESLFNHITQTNDPRACDLYSKLSPLIKEYKGSDLTTKIKHVMYDTCDCGSKMKVFENASELICPSCGKIYMIYGTIFEDTQFYNQEGSRVKHGCYDPSRHCKFWVHRIQAKETTDIPKECIEHLVQCIKRDNITDGRKLLCGQLRLYLKDIGMTEYNDHVPLIRKIITGVVPPQLTNDELRQLYNLFDKSVTTFDIVKPSSKSNTIYYPYLIYKILDIVLQGGTRKKNILECIHLQSRDTLITNDNLWEHICNIIGIKYTPTDRNSQLIDIISC
jgi:hypothetical protein